MFLSDLFLATPATHLMVLSSQNPSHSSFHHKISEGHRQTSEITVLSSRTGKGSAAPGLLVERSVGTPSFGTRGLPSLRARAAGLRTRTSQRKLPLRAAPAAAATPAWWAAASSAAACRIRSAGRSSCLSTCCFCCGSPARLFDCLLASPRCSLFASVA